MRLNLVLSGGASRGAFHLGALHYFEQNNIKINAYSGSSIGSIIAVSHASGLSAKAQLDIFTSKQIKQALKFNYFKKGLIRIDKEHKILDELLPIKKLEALPTKVFVNAYDTKKKQMHYFDTGDSHLLCMASSALVPLFKPIAYENMNLIDGGLIDNIPIRPFENYKEPILCIDLLPRKELAFKRRFNPFKQIKRKIFKRHIDNANFSRQHTDMYLSTQQLLHFPMFTFKGLEQMFDLGYHEAQHFFEQDLNSKLA